jgi:hypothetical protein
MSENFTRRNHHIPQKYQLGFADASERVHLYDRKRGAYVYGRPKNIGFENDFYTTVTKSGERIDEVEKLLAQVEGKTWPLLDKLANKIDLSGIERSTVAFFVALMKTRTTTFDAFSKSMTDVIAKSMLHLFNPDQETMQRRYKEMTGQTLSQERAAEMYQALQEQKFNVVPPRQNVIKSMLDVAAGLERGLVAMEWEVYSAPSDCKFITCDNPFITIPPPDLDTEIQGFGPLTPGVMNLIPIDSRTALFMRRGSRRQVTFKRANRSLIREVNIMIVSASDRLIIACDEPQLRKLVAKCKPAEWVNSFETIPVSPPWLADRFKKDTHKP